MAILELNIVGLHSQIEAADENAVRILQGMLRQNGYNPDDMEPQAQADAVLAVIIKFIQESAASHEIIKSRQVARDAVLNAPPTWIT